SNGHINEGVVGRLYDGQVVRDIVGNVGVGTKDRHCPRFDRIRVFNPGSRKRLRRIGFSRCAYQETARNTTLTADGKTGHSSPERAGIQSEERLRAGWYRLTWHSEDRRES